MAPVVNDQARALLKDLVAVLELAAEVRLQFVVVFVEHLEALECVRWHGFDARVRLLRSNVLPHGEHRYVRHEVEFVFV